MSADSPSPSPSQLKTIVTLFIIMRVMILLFYTPQGLLNAYTDYQYYYRIAQLSDQGYYPFVNMWYEHLPVMAYTAQLVYRAVQSIVPMGGLDSFGYQLFARLLGGVMLIFETGVLILIHRIATKAWGIDKANWLSWVYALFGLPMFFWNVSQTSSTMFFMLLALHWFMTGRRSRSAIALGLGIMTKLTPIFLLGSIARWLWPQRSALVRYALIVVIAVAAILTPFVLLGGGQWVAASLASNLTRASWATPWAIIDGNWGVGNVGEVATRIQIELATKTYGNPPAIPGLLVLAAFGVLYLWLFSRPVDSYGPRQLIWFTTLIAMLFLLWSKGWSPHWVTLVIPLILLSFPDQSGLRLLLLLTLFVILEWPLSDALQLRPLFAIAIAGRTVIFIVVAILAARHLWPARVPSRVLLEQDIAG